MWTKEDKTFALVIHSKTPKCYRLLKKIIPLSSKSTLNSSFKNIPFQSGLNKRFFQKLSQKVRKLQILDNTCALLFDEISLCSQLTFAKAQDKIIGYVDLGQLGRKNEFADHELVFMAVGLHKNWKQPIAYYFTKGTVKTLDLKMLILNIIESLQNVGLNNVMATVCDQGSNNRAIGNNPLLKYQGPYFFVKGE